MTPDPLELVRAWTRRPDWFDDALCRGAGPSLFFPDAGETSACQTACQVCDECPIRAQCAEMGAGERFGVWGGTSGRARLRLIADTHQTTRNAKGLPVWGRQAQGRTA